MSRWRNGLRACSNGHVISKDLGSSPSYDYDQWSIFPVTKFLHFITRAKMPTFVYVVRYKKYAFCHDIALFTTIYRLSQKEAVA